MTGSRTGAPDAGAVDAGAVDGGKAPASAASAKDAITMLMGHLRGECAESSVRCPEPFSMSKMDQSEGPRMRRSRGALLPPAAVARPRRRHLYAVLRNAVLDGVLAPGERLPSSRQAASDYGVSRGLIEEVFGLLTEEGFLTRAVGRGTFVAPGASGLTAPAARRARHPSPVASRRGREFAAAALCREPPAPRPFNAGIADTAEFSWPIWIRLQARAAREAGAAAMNAADPRGVPALRAAIAR